MDSTWGSERQGLGNSPVSPKQSLHSSDLVEGLVLGLSGVAWGHEGLCSLKHLPHSPQMEIDDGAELTAEFLYDEVHPKQHAFKQAFAKPKGPVGKRGQKRLIRGPGENGDES